MEDGKWQGERGKEMAAQMDLHTTQNAAWPLPVRLRADEKKVMCFKEVKGNKGFPLTSISLWLYSRNFVGDLYQFQIV
ncbi:hypothetical protein AA0312_1618 [Acetobacter tropicalis NRIC 0312]|uniref:Uncharacterized protein n=1 Tax=Acetobacter tropicalis TaxID=104102 RepID=A0A511FQ64_9PROT|nr:hypothetical protein AD944_07770 [Acetobacter tropicalis]GAL96137.1 hypothetical protein ATR1_017c0043 [Acetobacter tropicalis]GBR69938.1 hypothetical protein AA0312_1618 [Acetobacter tropicalis NRIC 0312]GEL51045.1 hypothetical protein ATR01nite_21200 [Acetobacter tropicalis]